MPDRDAFIKTDAQKLKEKYTEEEIRLQIDEFGKAAQLSDDKVSILYIDDEQDALDNFKSLYRRSYQVFTTTSIQKAYQIITDELPQVILSDQRMPEMTGVEFFKSIIPEYSEAIRILVTGYSDIDAIIGAINDGEIYKYIAKPYPTETMKQTIDNAVEVYFLRKNKEELLQKLTRANSQLEYLLQKT